jgi:hypothetical protein
MASPIPDPNALRRDRKDDASWTTLPAKVDVKVPAWPLVDQTEREVELWVEIWKRPQALLWKQNSQEVEVALYVRQLASVEKHESGGAADHAILIRQADNLLLSIPAMYKARVKIAADEIKARSSKRGAGKTPATAGSSVKDRFKVVQNGGA